MNTKHSGKIAIALITVIVILIAVAIGLSTNNDANQMVDDYYSEDASKQISLEMKKDQPAVEHAVEFEGLGQKDTEELFYIVRVNHDIDMDMNFRIDVVKAEDGIDEAIKLKVYDTTDQKVIYDEKLAQLDGKVYTELQLANASDKNDTRYEMTLYFDQQVGDRYEDSGLEIKLNWYVSEDAAEDLKGPKTDVKWIFYSFGIAAVVMVLFFVFGRKHMNPEVFMTPEERGVDNGLEGIDNNTVLIEKKKKKK